MAKFELLSDLPQETRNEIERIQRIPAAQRIQKDINFLAALTPYLNNEVIEYDDDNLIVQSAGLTLPTGYSGFKKGAFFTDKDALSNGLYMNIGDETSATWALITDGGSSGVAKTGDTMTGPLQFSGATNYGVKLSSLTSTQKNALTAAEGMLIHNSTLMQFQKYENGQWVDVSKSPGTLIVAVADSGYAADYYTDGVADEVQLNAASLAAGAGGKVIWKKGSYTVSDSVRLYSDRHYEGEGWGTIIQLGAAVRKDVIINDGEDDGNTNITLRNLVIDGNKASQAPGISLNGLLFIGVSNFLVEGVYAKNVGTTDVDDIAEGFAFSAGTTKGSVIGCFAEGNNHYGFNSYNASYIKFIGNHSFDNGRHGFGSANGSHHNSWIGNTATGNLNQGFWIRNTHSSNIKDNTIDMPAASLYGIQLKGNSTEDPNQISDQRNVVEGNTITGLCGMGIYVQNHANYNIFSNNTIKVSGWGFYISSAEWVTVTTNTIINASVDGILIESSIGSKIINNTVKNSNNNGILIKSDRCIVNGNTCMNNSQSAAGSYNGITITDSLNTTALANVCYDDQGTKTQGYGIAETGTTDQSNIVGNQVTGNLTGALLIIGTNTIYRPNNTGASSDLLSVVQFANNTTTQTSFTNAVQIINTGTTNNNGGAIVFIGVASDATQKEAAAIRSITRIHNAGTFSGDLAFWTNNAGSRAEAMRIQAGRVGIGTTAPTASVHIAAGVSAANGAPLKLTSGVNLTAPEAGAIEYDGTHLYFTDETPTRQTIATQAYVDGIAQGLDLKASVRVATTANITLSGAQTIDGVSVIAGDRVLVKDQSTGADNGIYVCASGAWSRATDANVSAEVTSGMYTFVEEGTVNADNGWVLTTNDPITLGSTSLTFAQFNGAGQVIAGTGIGKSGNTISNTGVLSLTGTSNQVTVSASTGAITLSLPQNIHTGASPTFAGLSLGTGNLSTIGNVSIDGTAARDITVARATSGAGNNLTVAGGGAQSGSTNQLGGQLILATGVGTGNAAATAMLIKVGEGGGGSGTTDQTLNTVGIFQKSSATQWQLILNSTTTGQLGHGISIRGTLAATVGIIRHTTSNTAGVGLTVNAGGATSGATNKAGGDLTLASGISTGSGGGNIIFQTTASVAASTTDNSLVTRMAIDNTGSTVITSASGAGSLVVGANGTNNPVLLVYSNAGSVATGLRIQGKAAAAGLVIDVISSGTNENMTLDAKGSGTIALNTVATGNILLGSKIGKYNNVNTAGFGVPAIYASGRATGQTAAAASVATYTVPASDGTFLVSANVLVTTATVHNFTVTVDYTDEGNTARTLTLSFSSLAGASLNAIVNTGGAVPYEGIPLQIRCKAATTITIATVGTFTTVTYNVEGHIVQIA